MRLKICLPPQRQTSHLVAPPDPENFHFPNVAIFAKLDPAAADACLAERFHRYTDDKPYAVSHSHPR